MNENKQNKKNIYIYIRGMKNKEIAKNDKKKIVSGKMKEINGLKSQHFLMFAQVLNMSC